MQPAVRERWASLNDILKRLRATLGPLDGTPQPLDGGITNRNFRVTLGGEEYVMRQPGKDTDAARHRPRGRADRDRGGRAPGHRARRSRRPSRTAWSRASSPAGARRPRAGRARRGDRARAAPLSRLRHAPARRSFSRPRRCSTHYAARSCAGAAGRSAEYSCAACAAADRIAAALGPHDAPSLPQRPARRATSSAPARTTR